MYDGYRPQKAVADFWAWSQEITDISTDSSMQAIFYPDIQDKPELFQRGYLAKRSGHSRGSTVDLTIAKTHFNEEVGPKDNNLDVGTPFDFLGRQSHYGSKASSTEAQANRKYLRDLMVAHGFVPYDKEWWHFTLQDEPFPDTYFDFPVR